MAGSDFQQTNNEPMSVPRNNGGNSSDSPKSAAIDGMNGKSDSSSMNSIQKQSNQNKEENNNSKNKSQISTFGIKGFGKSVTKAVKALVQAVQMGAKLSMIMQLVLPVIKLLIVPVILAVVVVVTVWTAVMNFFSESTAVVASLDDTVCDVFVDRALIANPYGELNTDEFFIGGLVDLHDLENTGEFTQAKNDANVPGHLDGYTGTIINVKSARTAIARRVYSVMLSYGLRPEQAFGVLGNWLVESNLDPTAVETVKGDDFSLGATKQYFNGMDFHTQQCLIADLHEGGSYTSEQRRAYFNDHSTIGRLGIGLAQWTDIYPDGDNEMKAGTWGRNSKLRRYAMLMAKDETVNDILSYNGDRNNYAIWYDADVQLAYMLDTSDVGDENAAFLKKWAAGFPWNRLVASNGKIRGATKDDEFWDDDCPDENSEHPYNEEYSGNEWRRLGVNDDFAESTGTGDKQIRENMPWSDDQPSEILNPFPVTDDNPDSMDSALCEPNNSADKYNAPVEADDLDDGYYDYMPTFDKNLEGGNSNTLRLEASNKAVQILSGLWDDEGGVGKKHKENVYNFEDYCDGFACDECLNRGPEEHIGLGEQPLHICAICDGGSHEGHERCYDMDGNGQTDYIEKHTWSLVEKKDSKGNTYTEWVRSISVTHEMRGGDSDATGVGGGGTLKKKSVCGCAEKKFRRCFNKTYRHILGRFTVEQYTEQFATQWEGTQKDLAQRKANAVTLYEIWWRNTNTDKSKALDPNSSQNQRKYNGLFKVELGYGAGIKSIIEHTPDEESKIALRSKNYREDMDLLNCKHYVTRRNDDLAIAGALIGGAKSFVGTGKGTAVYMSIQDQVLGENVYYKSCDHTVATAVRWSGVDDDYPAGPTLSQMQYLITSPRWVEIDWSGDESELEPGDIFIRKDTMAMGSDNEPEGVESNVHHTFMYLGEDFIEDYAANNVNWSPSAVKGCNVVEGSFDEYGATFHKRNLISDAKTYHVFRCLYRVGSGKSKYASAQPIGTGGDGNGGGYDNLPFYNNEDAEEDNNSMSVNEGYTYDSSDYNYVFNVFEDAGITTDPNDSNPNKNYIISSDMEERLANMLATFTGVAYSHSGAATTSATDCSGLVWQVYKDVLPGRYSADTYGKSCTYAVSDPQPGDLVFFKGTSSSRTPDQYSHVGIYLGNGKFFHASSGSGECRVSDLGGSYYQSHFAGYRRINEF